MRVMRYEHAVETLFQAPLDQFVAERKRLAAELKAEGDRTAAAKLAKLTRPPISAWVVDQLWWRARPEFVALFDSAERVRRGDFGANAAHRDALASLRARAAQILSEAQSMGSSDGIGHLAHVGGALTGAASRFRRRPFDLVSPPGIYEDKPFESYFSGNTVQICPVGALTGAAYRFRSRPFDLVSTPSVCEHCASGDRKSVV